MRNKVNIIITLSLLLIVIMGGTYAYSRYAQAAIAEGIMPTAKWDILVNKCDIVNPDPENKECFETKIEGEGEEQIVRLVRNFRIEGPFEDEEDYQEYKPYDDPDDKPQDEADDPNIAPNKIAPGRQAIIKINVDSNNTKVAYKYTLKVKKPQQDEQEIDNNSIKLYIQTNSPNGQTNAGNKKEEVELFPDNSYEYKVFASQLATNKVVDTITIRVAWGNDSTGENDETDTKMGTKLDKPIEIPIEIHFEQILKTATE